MAKSHHQNKLASSSEGGVMVEHNVAIDDSLLPNADELKRLKVIDPTIIQWMKERAELEQNARIGFNKGQLQLADYNLRKTHKFNFTALVFSFILFLSIISAICLFCNKGTFCYRYYFWRGCNCNCCCLFYKSGNQVKIV